MSFGSASGYYSCGTAYSAAFAATQGAICLLYGTTTTTTCTEHVGTNGLADLTSLSCAGGTSSVTTFCTVTNTSCTVEEEYDQTGNGFHVIGGTPTNYPLFVLNCQNSLPCAQFDGANTKLVMSGSFTAVPNASMAAVAIRTGAFTTGTAILGRTGNANFGFSASANSINIDSGGQVYSSSPQTTDSVWHAIQIVYGATSYVNSDGSGSTGAVTAPAANSTFILGAFGSGTGIPTGKIAETVWWGTVTLTPTQIGNVCHRQYLNWATPNAMLNRRQLLAGSAALAIMPKKASAYFTHGVGQLVIQTGWNTLNLGCGGLSIGFDIAPDGTMVCRTDVGNVYGFTGTTATVTDPTKRWKPLLTYASLGSGYVASNGSSNGGLDLVIAPTTTTNLYGIFPNNTYSPNFTWALYYSTNFGAAWTKSALTFIYTDGSNGSWRDAAHRIAVDPANSSVVYCGIPYGNSGVARRLSSH